MCYRVAYTEVKNIQYWTSFGAAWMEPEIMLVSQAQNKCRMISPQRGVQKVDLTKVEKRMVVIRGQGVGGQGEIGKG